MKKLILLALAMAAVTVSKAQVVWEARLGAAVSKFTETDTKMKLGMKAGLNAEFALSDLFALKPGLHFTMKGSSKDDSFATSNSDAMNLSYLEIPVLASFRFPVTEGFSLALNAGPYAALRLNSPDWAKSADIKRADFGVAAGLDFCFGKLCFGPEVEYGLVKVGNGNDRNLAYFLCLGYKF